MNEKVLVFSSREICYLSGNFFAHQIADAFEQLGCEVTLCEFAAGDDLDRILMPLLEDTYAVALDFNSMIPQMVLEDGTAYLDSLKAPFFNYVVDHPLFHYNVLSSSAKNLNVITLDEAQRDYVKRYHPNVVSAHMLPLGATKALYEGEKNEDVRVFLPGTYDDPDGVYAIVKEAPEPLRGYMEALIEQRVYDPLTPMEELFRALLKERDTEVTDAQFALYMNAMYAVDAYVRDYFRKKMLDNLLDEKIPVTVMGTGWNHYEHRNGHCLKRDKEVPFSLSFEMIAKEHIILNVSPIFNRGMHDRVPGGMANHTCVMTDFNPYLAAHFTDGEDICLYSLAGDDVCEKATELIDDAGLREKIENRAALRFEEELNWKMRAKKILEFVS